MDIGRCFKDAWNLLMKDLAPLAVAAVIAAVVIGVVALIAGGTVAATADSDAFTITSGNQIDFDDLNWGALALAAIVIAIVAVVVGAWEYSTVLKIMLRRVRESRAADMGDLKLGLEGIGSFIVALLVLGIAIALGFVLLIIPGLILMTIWAYVIVLIADKRSSLGDAMSESTALAKRPGYLMTFVTLLVGAIVIGVVNGIVGMIPVVGTIIGIFVGLYYIAYLVAMYFQATGETHLIDHALYGTPLPAVPGAEAAGYPPAPAAPAAGAAYPPAPSAPMAAPPAPPPPAAEPPAPPPPPAPSPAGAPDAWAAASDPLAQPPAAEPPATSAAPAVDESSGTLEQHCSQCGAAIGASDDFCQACGFELSGGEGHAHAPEESPAQEGDASAESEGGTQT